MTVALFTCSGLVSDPRPRRLFGQPAQLSQRLFVFLLSRSQVVSTRGDTRLSAGRFLTLNCPRLEIKPAGGKAKEQGKARDQPENLASPNHWQPFRKRKFNHPSPRTTKAVAKIRLG